MAKCQWKPKDELLRNRYAGCPYESEKGHKYCLFHISLEEKRNQPDLAEKFKHEFRKLYNKGEWDFFGFVFPDNMSLSDMARYDFRQPFLANDGESMQTATYTLLTFNEAEFGKNINFLGAKFGSVYFRHAKFSGHANFNNAEFIEGVDFSGAEFIGDANFWRVEFKEGAFFNFSLFSENADFSFVKFNECVGFGGVEFSKHVNFSESEFGAKGSFIETIFHQSLDFSYVKGHASAYEGRGGPRGKEPVWELDIFQPGPPVLVFENAEFNGPAEFHRVDLSRTRFQQVDLSNISLLHSQISQTKFISCLWGDGPENTKLWHRSDKKWYGFRRPRLLFDELLWRKRSVLKGVDEEQARIKVWEDDPVDQVNLEEEPYKNLQASDIEVLALQLKQSLETTRDPIPAGDFHFAAMEMKREQDLEMWQESKKRVKAGEQNEKAWSCRFRSWGFWWYKIISGYGECYGRTLLWLGVLVATSTLIFAAAGASTFGKGLTYWGRLEPALFYSFQHVLPFKFSTAYWYIGKADVAMRWFSLAETMIGTTLFAFFALALRRRFKR